ncbi:MAG: alpha/beta fold hydrolase [Sandaracinaceae bacterium]
MAGHLHMLSQAGAPPVSESTLRHHLTRLAEARGSDPWFDDFTPASITGGAGRLHLDVRAAEGARATVVFVPGTNAYALLYGELLRALSDRRLNVVGLDPRGHGRSDGLRGSYTLSELIDDLDAAVTYARRRFGGPVFVAGSSQGGITAFYYAAMHDDVAGALCHNIADLDDPESVRCMRHPGLGAQLRPFLPRLAELAPEFPVPMCAYLDLASEPVRGAGSAADILLSDPLTVPFIRLRALASLARGPIRDPGRQIRCPVLVLHAGADAIFPADYVARVLDRVGAPTSLRVYPGLAHYMVVDDVPAFLEDVLAWTDSVLSSGEPCPFTA